MMRLQEGRCVWGAEEDKDVTSGRLLSMQTKNKWHLFVERNKWEI